jgi:serine/threonine protein kinase
MSSPQCGSYDEMLTPGALLQNRYRILRRIGGGGMGTVYLAEDTRLPGRRCAVKEMCPDQLPLQDRSWAIQAFQQEAQMLANLSHPGLTAVTDFFSEGGNWYLVMDYVEGEALEDQLEQAPGSRLALQEALSITRQLCDVLEYLHSRNPLVVFRDLKPSNVMLTPRGEVKLIDFGIARFFKPGRTRDTVRLGTPGYAAPEQYSGQSQTDPSSDIYSLGVLLHQMLTGHDPTMTPFSLPPARSMNLGIPPEVDAVIQHATQHEPPLRFQSVGEMRQALFAPAGPTNILKNVGSTQGQVPWLMVGAGLAVVLCVITAGVLVFRSLQPPIPQPPIPVVSSSVPAATISVTSNKTATASPRPPLATPPPASPMTATPVRPATVMPSPTPSDVVSPKITYVKGSVQNTDVYVANADGSGRTCVACRSCDEAESAWSPDGSHIAYQSNCGGNYDIWVVDVGTGSVAQLTDTPGVDEREPDWSPDGFQIVYRTSTQGSDRNSDGELWVMNGDGSSPRRLDNMVIMGRSPRWSPNGDRILFMSERSGRWQIYVYDPGLGTTTRLTDCGTNCRWPCWSPDGRYVAYHSTTTATGSGSALQETIWLIPANGGQVSQLITGQHPGRPTWSQSGQIAFNSDQGIEVINANGSRRQVLIASDENWAPCWSR